MDDKFDLDELINALSKKEPSQENTIDESSILGFDEEHLQHLKALCESKAEEFAVIGYDNISSNDIWRYILLKFKDKHLPLHRIVNEILSLKVTTFMNWETINAYKGT